MRCPCTQATDRPADATALCVADAAAAAAAGAVLLRDSSVDGYTPRQHSLRHGHEPTDTQTDRRTNTYS